MSRSAANDSAKITSTFTSVIGICPFLFNYLIVNCSVHYDPFSDWSGRSLYIADADLSNDFPFKNGTSNYEATFTFWFRQDLIVDTQLIFGKGSDYNHRSFNMYNSSGRFSFEMSQTGGAVQSIFADPSLDITAGHWYHVALKISADPNPTYPTISLILYDQTTDTLYDEYLMPFTNYNGLTMNIDDGVFYIGGGMTQALAWTYSGLGHEDQEAFIDDFRVYNRILSNDEIAAIRSIT